MQDFSQLIRTLSTVGSMRPTGKAGDFVLTTGEGAEIPIEVKSYASVRPSDRRILQSTPAQGVVRIIVAPHISEAAAQNLEAAGLSWLSLDGPAYIKAPGVQVRILGQAGVKGIGKSAKASKQLGFTWTTVARDVAEYVLTRTAGHPQPNSSVPLPRTRDAAQAVHHSPAATANAMRGLGDRGWLRKVGGSRGRGSSWELIDPTGLLDGWSPQGADPGEILAHGLIGDPLDYARTRLTEVLPAGQWCLAGTSASELIAPLLTSTPLLEVAVTEAVAHSLTSDLSRLGLRRVETGHRVRFSTVPHVTLATASDLEGLPVTSPVRTYRDVIGLAGRGAQVAAHLRQVALGF